MSHLNALALSLIVCLTAATAATAAAQDTAQPRTQKAAGAASAVNINTAAASELQKLPGIGAATATRILEYRQKNGPFKKAEELMNIRGIGEKSFLKLKPLIVVTAPKTEPGER
ncbi:MAG: helix-hairpin-helix domain-containing protein [Vicinamibacterales bacterium]